MAVAKTESVPAKVTVNVPARLVKVTVAREKPAARRAEIVAKMEPVLVDNVDVARTESASVKENASVPAKPEKENAAKLRKTVLVAVVKMESVAVKVIANVLARLDLGIVVRDHLVAQRKQLRNLAAIK